MWNATFEPGLWNNRQSSFFFEFQLFFFFLLLISLVITNLLKTNGVFNIIVLLTSILLLGANILVSAFQLTPYAKVPLINSDQAFFLFQPFYAYKTVSRDQTKSEILITLLLNSWFSHDVTASMLESPNNETAATLESRLNPPGIELLLLCKLFLLFSLKNIAVDHVSETQEFFLTLAW